MRRTTTAEATTQYEVHELIRERWSPVVFDRRPMEPEKLQSLFEAARWAPSSYNEQPWRFIFATRDNPEQFQRLLDCLVEGNQAWAQSAPVLAFSIAKMSFERNGKANRHALHDVGLATENLALQAVSLGLGVHPMAGFHIEKARELLGIPEGYEPVAAIAIGYISDSDSQPGGLRKKQQAPRVRRPLGELVFQGEWGAIPVNF